MYVRMYKGRFNLSFSVTMTDCSIDLYVLLEYYNWTSKNGSSGYNLLGLGNIIIYRELQCKRHKLSILKRNFWYLNIGSVISSSIL